jgi:hypothetical protein
MNKQILLAGILVLMNLHWAIAQKDVLSAGGDGSSANGSVSFSVGQVGYTYITGEAGSATLGVQQSNVFNIVATEDLDKTWEISFYPNPASEAVFIELKDAGVLQKFNLLKARLYDPAGRLIVEQEIQEPVTRLPINNLTDAFYILQISQDQTMIKSFKLFKTN